MDNVAINKARIVYYGFFASLLAFNLTKETYNKGFQALEILSTNPIDEQSELAFSNLTRRLTKGGYESLLKESNQVFCNPSSSPMATTSSYYNDGRDDGLKRVEMIDYVLQSKFRRNADTYKEHEDHIEFIMLFLAKLITEEAEGNTKAGELGKTVFSNILEPMIDQFSDNLFNHEESRTYKQVALALRSFMEFERVYLNIDNVQTKQPANKRTRVQEAPQQLDNGGCIKMNTGLSA